MGILKYFRSKRSKPKAQQELQPYPRRYNGRDHTSKLPLILLYRVFTFVCPHAEDDSYQSHEESLGRTSCPSCDLKNLVCCSLVNHTWKKATCELLYHTIRIDPVHYCPYGLVLSDQRKRRHINPAQVPIRRLERLESTLRSSAKLASRIQLVKLSFTTRETAGAVLTRLVSLLANVRYVDLPEGFYKADQATAVLRHEMQARCPNVRKMTYMTGAEHMFEKHAHDAVWSNLEVMEIRGLNISASAFRTVMGAFSALRELIISNVKSLDDSAFETSSSLPGLPLIRKLVLEDMPLVSSAGLIALLSRPPAQAALSRLTLVNTNVEIESVHAVLARGGNLEHLSISQSAKGSTRLHATPPLSSRNLKTLAWEITAPESDSPSMGDRIQSTDPYYSYLGSSLQAQTMPGLRKVYVRDSRFPQTLVSGPRSASSDQTIEGILAHSNASRYLPKDRMISTG
ncbi:MAG: hypothetical protein M1828_001683 [Chrysothrix sp. TS-e1954]|nr:MAG: hypothetical protein M1828_001683 [Chrysothrix sp. TS-e1954]